MIIYKRKKKQLVIPCGLGPVVCPDIDHLLQQKTADSSTVLQQIEPDEGYYGLSRVTINPLTDDNLLPGNIKAGVTILGVLGTYSGELINLQAKTVDPTLQGLVVLADAGYDGLSSVTVNPVTSDIDPDIQAGNIRRGVEILGVTGTFDGGPLQSKTVDSSTSSQTIEPDNGNYGLSSVTVNPYTLDSKTVNSSTAQQVVTSSEDGLSSVTVNPYTLESKTQNITVNGIYVFTPTSADGLSSVDISVNVADIPPVVQSKSVTYNENGEYTVTPDQGYDGLSSVDISVNIPPEPVVLQSKTVDSSTSSQNVIFDQGYDGLSSVTVNPYTLDSKTVNSSTAQQVITSDADGLSSVMVEPYVLDSKAVDPSTSQITVNSSADGLSSVTVNAVTSNIDPDIQAGNIKRGVEILGVTGTFDGGSLGAKTVDSSTISQTITPESSDYGLSSVTVNPYTLDTKTVNSSTAQQVVTSDEDGLSSVTVNPYVLDSKTVDSSTVSQIVTSSEDGLSSVTVNPYVLDSKTVNSSTAQQVITSDEDGLSSVTVNPYTLDTKTVDSSTVSQVVTSDEDGLSSVTVNPYTVEANSSTLTTNGTYTFTPTNADALSSVTVDVSINTVNNQSKTVDSSTVSQIIAPDQGYTGLSDVTVNPYTLETATVNASTSAQVITPSAADGLSSVTINAAALQNRTVDASTVSLDIQKTSTDYYGLRHVYINPVTAAIDPDIQADNIKRGVEILGVTGTFDGGSLGTKTVNSSTSSQIVTPESTDYGLSSVTVNPYTIEADSSTLTSNGTYVFTPQNADALSSVTVDVSVNTVNNQNKTVNPSTNSQSITADSGYTGLGTVTVNPMSLQTKSITANTTFPATIVPDSGYDGFTQLDIDIQGVDYQINAVQSDSSVSDTSTFDVYAYVNKAIVHPVMTDAVTVDSSVNQQVITPVRDAINQVTVNPYTVEADSSTLTSNGTYTFTPTNADALSSVTVDVSINTVNNQSKTVDSSIVSQSVTPDQGYTGLSDVTVNPYTVEAKSDTLTANGRFTYTPTSADALSQVTIDVSINTAPDLQAKTVDSSTSSQIVQADQNYDGLSQVTVNPYTVESDSSTLTVNGTYVFTPQNADALSQVTIDVSTVEINNQSKTVNPSTNEQIVTPDSGYTGLSSVTVNPNEGELYVSLGFSYVTTPEVRNCSGYATVRVPRPYVNQKIIDPSTVQQVFNPPAADSYQYYSQVTVNAVDASIDANITAGNIKKDVTILGVTGTFEGGAPEYDAIYNALIQI